MTPKRALEQLYEIDSITDPNLIFGSRYASGNPPKHLVTRLDASETLVQELAAKCVAVLQNRSTVAPAQAVKPYNAQHIPEADQPRYVELTDPHIASIHGSIPDHLAEVPLFHRDQPGVRSRLTYYALVGRDQNDKQVRFYRHMNVGAILKETGKVMAVLDGRRFEKLDQQPIHFDARFVAATYGGYLFTFAGRKFESIFAYREGIGKVAKETLEMVEADNLRIVRANEFNDFVLGNALHADRIRRIAQSPHLQAFTVAGIQDAIDRCGLQLAVTDDDGTPQIEWETGQEIELLHLLEDYYVAGMATGKEYGSRDKEPLS